MLYSAGRYGEAHAALQKALDLNPKIALVHLTLSKILIEERKPEKPRQKLRENQWIGASSQARHSPTTLWVVNKILLPP
jgi:predicted Zn-dependent protease